MRRVERRLKYTTGLVSLKTYEHDNGSQFPFPPPTMWDMFRRAGLYATDEEIAAYELEASAYEREQAIERNRVACRERYHAKKAMEA